MTRAYYVTVRGFDFDGVYVRTRSRGRARYLCADGFHDAGFGTLGEGFQRLGGCRLAPEAESWPLIYPERGEGYLSKPEGCP